VRVLVDFKLDGFMDYGRLVDFYYVLLWTILAYYYVLYELLWSLWHIKDFMGF
jgi:hypothetical protein